MEDNIKKEVLEKAEQGLWRAIYVLTWAGLLWGKLRAIELSEMRYRVLCQLDRRQEAISSLLSTYYTAWGNAAAKMSASPFGREWMNWAWRAIKYRAKTRRLAGRLMNEMINLEFPKFEFGLGELMILGRVSFRLKYYKNAIVYYRRALGLDSVSKENRALILAEMGEVLLRVKTSEHLPLVHGTAIIESALDMLKEISDAKTKVRVYKTVVAADLFIVKNYRGHRPLIKDINALLSEAIHIAKENSLGDQLVKIEALRKEVERIK